VDKTFKRAAGAKEFCLTAALLSASLTVCGGNGAVGEAASWGLLQAIAPTVTEASCSLGSGVYGFSL
jgi:hypothetical protein